MKKWNHMISIAIPYYKEMKNAEFFLDRAIKSIKNQTYDDYEIVITEDGKMAENTNSAIRKSKGELIKVLFMDDFLAHPNALKNIVDNFVGNWMITGASTNPHPYWTGKEILKGNNKLGSPSALTIRNKDPILFDEFMGWALDCDYYWRMYQREGMLTILDEIGVVIGEHNGQATNRLSDEEKYKEINYLINKYDTSPEANN